MTTTVEMTDADIVRFWSHVNVGPDCWEWQGYIQSNGYAKFNLDRRSLWAHRVAWMAVHGEDPGEGKVLHRCDNPRCVRPTHLFLGTQADNMADAVAKGRTARGEASGPRRRDYGETCRRGHLRSEFTGLHHGRRYCKRCHADRMAEARRQGS